MALEQYIKDGDGRIGINIGGTIVPRAVDTADKTDRNLHGRVFIHNGEAFSVVVKAGGKEYMVCDGTATAESGKMCAIFVRVRAEADVTEPVEE